MGAGKRQGWRESFKKSSQALFLAFPAAAIFSPDPACLIFTFPFYFPCLPYYLRACHRLEALRPRDVCLHHKYLHPPPLQKNLDLPLHFVLFWGGGSHIRV